MMKIIVVGDFCPGARVAEMFEKGDFESVLGEVKPIVSETDYSIVNFECPVCYGDEKPIDKCGPNLQCGESGIQAVKWAGFNCVTLANNHFLDFGARGVANTLKACKATGIDTVGGGKNLGEASRTLYKEINGERLAIINCCEHEFSIATDSMAGSNPLNPIQQFYAISEARQKADYVLVIVHGGHEHFQLPSHRMQETYRFFIDAGADAVVNHHQHCYSGYEVYREKPIFYGLGNFCFDKSRKMAGTWYDGLLCEIVLSSGAVSYKLHPYTQCHKGATISLLPPNAFDHSLEKLNQAIGSKEKLNEEIARYYSVRKGGMSAVFEPIQNRFILAAQKRGWLPPFISHKQRLKILDYLFCESHRDIFMWPDSHAGQIE